MPQIAYTVKLVTLKTQHKILPGRLLKEAEVQITSVC